MANTRKKILPNKPYFFKFLINDFQKSIDIPIAFFYKYLECQKKYEKAELRSVQGKVWPVQIVGNQIIGKGWTKFQRDHDLHVGEFLVFRHEGNMVFDVMVFEPSACEKREYNLPLKDEDSMEEEDNEDASEDNEIITKASKEAKKRHQHKVNSGDGANHVVIRCHRYVSRVKPYEIRSGSVFLPKNFTRDSILNYEGCNQIMIRDEEGRLWPIQLGRIMVQNRVFMKAKGWKDLRVGNNLNVGDGFVLELIEEGRIPLLSFQKLKGNYCASEEGTGKKLEDIPSVGFNLFERKSDEDIEDDSEETEIIMGASKETKKHHWHGNSVDGANRVMNPHRYVGRVKPHEILNTAFLPTSFTKDNILNYEGCNQIIIRGQDGSRLWPIELGRSKRDNQVFMKKKELKRNCRVIEEGAGTKLKDIPNVASKLSKRKADEDNEDDSEDNEDTVGAPKEAQKHNRHINSGDGANRGMSPHRYFSHVKPYEMHKAAFLPKSFTKYNVLNSEGCKEIIIKDQEGRLWPIQLGRTRHNRVFMKKKGWQDLRVGNNLNEGDGFVLELIQEGRKPLLSFKKLKGNRAIKKEKTTFKEKASSSRQIQLGHNYFCGTIWSSCIEKNKLNIPRRFARLHSLGRGSTEMMIKNQKGQSWQVKLHREKYNGAIYIGAGVKKFVVENNLKEGNMFKMELIRGGNKPIMHFHDLSFEGSS